MPRKSILNQKRIKNLQKKFIRKNEIENPLTNIKKDLRKSTTSTTSQIISIESTTTLISVYFLDFVLIPISVIPIGSTLSSDPIFNNVGKCLQSKSSIDCNTLEKRSKSVITKEPKKRAGRPKGSTNKKFIREKVQIINKTLKTSNITSTDLPSSALNDLSILTNSKNAMSYNFAQNSLESTHENVFSSNFKMPIKKLFFNNKSTILTNDNKAECNVFEDNIANETMQKLDDSFEEIPFYDSEDGEFTKVINYSCNCEKDKNYDLNKTTTANNVGKFFNLAYFNF